MRITKFITILISLFLISNCSHPNWNKPYGIIFKQMPKGGTPGFELGWQHGCESGLATNFGGSFFMSFYKWKKDEDIISKTPDYQKIRAKYNWKINWNDEGEIKRNLGDYKKVFWKSHKFCRHSAVGNHQNADFGGKYQPIMKDTRRYDPTKHSIMQPWTTQGRGFGNLSYW